jgi:hypothetical protein
MSVIFLGSSTVVHIDLLGYNFPVTWSLYKTKWSQRQSCESHSHLATRKCLTPTRTHSAPFVLTALSRMPPRSCSTTILMILSPFKLHFPVQDRTLLNHPEMPTLFYGGGRSVLAGRGTRAGEATNAPRPDSFCLTDPPDFASSHIQR